MFCPILGNYVTNAHEISFFMGVFMNIDGLIQDERKKQVHLHEALNLAVYSCQLRRNGFFTVTIEHEGNMPRHGIAVVLHGGGREAPLFPQS